MLYKKFLRLLSLPKAVVKFAAAPRRFPSSIAIAMTIYSEMHKNDTAFK